MKFREHRVGWLTLAALAAIFSSPAQAAYDDEMAQSELQPFVGAYLGVYAPDHSDLKAVAPGANDFNKFVPGGGGELGVAYGRFHVGMSVGYQVWNHGDLSSTEAAADQYVYPASFKSIKKSTITGNPSDTSTYVQVVDKWAVINDYTNYSYDMIPFDVFVDAALLSNKSPVNLLVGGSVGVSLMSIRFPYAVYGTHVGDTTRYYLGTNEVEHEAVFNLSAYTGVRINIAERLNLEAQIGWRVAYADSIYIGDMDANLSKQNGGIELVQAADGQNYYEKVGSTKAIAQALDMSGAYARVDLRWTFASRSDKERRDRTSMRRDALNGAMLASALQHHR